VCCLILAGFGFLATRIGGSSSSSSEAASSVPSAAASAEQRPDAGAAAPADGSGGGKQPEHAADEPTSAQGGFVVYSTGTSYEQSTLAAQVGRTSLEFSELNPAATASVPASAGEPSASSSSAGYRAPTAQLSGCVAAVTNGARPDLVDEATYDGIPAYIIAVPTEVWVVDRGCSAANTELIARVPLKG
jgi:hypothetical protein